MKDQKHCECEEHKHVHEETRESACGCHEKHERHKHHEHADKCGCHEEHEHKHEDGCCCHERHEHKHEETCGCHGEHHHEHHHHEHGKSCGCHEKHEYSLGCGCGHDHGHSHGDGCCCCEEGIERLEKKDIFLYIIGALVLVCAFIPMIPLPIRLICAGLVYVAFGISVWKEMIEGFAHKKIFTEFTLMCAASVGAVALGEYADAAAVMYLYALGETISGLANGRARKNIAELIAITPESVTVLDGGVARVCDPAAVEVGTIILVRAGERIPLDGVVHAGFGTADTSSVTGEQLPAELAVGERCLSGSVLLSGSLEIKVTHGYENSVASQLKAAVEEASERKAVTEKRITRVASVITPAAFVIGLLIFAVGALVTGQPAEWFRRGLVVLVCSCPCSLILSIPLTYFAGIGSAAGRGIVFRGGEVVDGVAKLGTVLFDKTGTLTEAELQFDCLVPAHDVALLEEDIHRIAYTVLMHSPHVAAQAYCAAKRGKVESSEANEIENIPGKGICACVDGHAVRCGSVRMLNEAGVTVDETSKTAIYLALEDRYLGRLEFSSRIKVGAAEAVADLRACGVERMAILSGDARATVDEVAEAVGIEERYAGVLPAEKLEIFEKVYREQKAKSRAAVAFCGDGLNDSAVIAASDVGIAMGLGGAAVTVEAADVILMDDSPDKLPTAVRLARRIVRIANQNIAISLGLKIGIAIVGVAILPSMELALVADVGAAVITVLNAMRAGKRAA